MNYSYFDTVGGHNFTEGTVPELVESIKELAISQKQTNALLYSLIKEMKSCRDEIKCLEHVMHKR